MNMPTITLDLVTVRLLESAAHDPLNSVTNRRPLGPDCNDSPSKSRSKFEFNIPKAVSFIELHSSYDRG